MTRRLFTRAARTRKVRGLTVGVIGLAVAVTATGGATAANVISGGFGNEQVGHEDASGKLLPDNQRITPYGQRSVITNGRLLASNLSPNGKQLAALSWQTFTGFVTVFDAATGKVLQQVGTGVGTDAVLGDGTVAADGPYYSPDGKSLWVPQTSDLLRFAVNADGTLAANPTKILLADTTGPWLPSGMAFSADGKTAYVALNGSNTLGLLNTTTNTLTKQITVGIAPRQVAWANGKLFVSNEGGRPTVPGDVTNLTDNTPVVSDASTGAAVSGTVSVVDPLQFKQTATIKVGLEPTALKVSGSTVFVANSNGDSVSVINAANNAVTQTFNVAPLPGSTVGSNPNAIEVTAGNRLLVSIGRDNALAVYQYNGQTSPVQYLGLIPTDWYPVGVQLDNATGQVVVTNDKGIGARGPSVPIDEGPNANVVTGRNTYDDTGSITRFAPPTLADLAGLTHQVFVDNDWQKLLAATPLATSKAAPVAIPVKLGDPSTIKHVFLIVKENRTYDQVLGDVGKGNSDNTLVQFGSSITPNQHALAAKYGLFDNFYDEGTLSADGHNWLMQADANDYIEKEFGAFWRSYPAQGGDALAYQRDGFLWNAAANVGKTVAAYGEYANFFNVPNTGAPTWADWYKDSQILEGKATGPLPVPIDKYKTYSDIPSLNAILDPNYPRFDTDVPDQYRVDIWQQAFAKAEQTNTLANLNLLWVPDDHTAGTSGADPYPTAQVADNDLAVGRIIDTISHSADWKDSAIFIAEDDSQAGVDHVDGHRAPLYVVSPYAKTGVTIDTYYSQLNVVKTIEQILGINPMNQEDRAAEPMRDAFTNTPNLTPFTTLPNQIPLTYGLTPATTAAAVGASPALVPAVPAAVQPIADLWAGWSAHQNFGGGKPEADASNPALLNRIDWYTATGWTKPYPGDKAILSPYQVPGWDKPSLDLGE
ncbi:alkaline phosphatase family protein [Acidothermaceae bacterium B102]|nr:alkaline phosphatase family protein [Acidothermaceae bacterium B102]